jgi:two-component system, cell cycle response regulator
MGYLNDPTIDPMSRGPSGPGCLRGRLGTLVIVNDAHPEAISLDSAAARGPIEVAPRLWWVGAVLSDDAFQCHSYLIEAGDRSVLVDPGSPITIEETLAKVEAVIPLENIAWLLVHHSDPDVAAALPQLAEVFDPSRVRVITEWRSATLMKHYDAAFETTPVEDLDWELDLDGRLLRFSLTPYLHFPGAFTTFDTATRTLLSSDLFGGFNRSGRLYATGPGDFEDLRQFHEHYMPSREILMAGLAAIRRRAPQIDMICPQHGYIIPAHLVEDMFEQMQRLECGIFLQSRSDADLRELLEVASALRRIEAVLLESADPATRRAALMSEIRSILPIDDVWFEVTPQPGDDTAPQALTERHRFDGEQIDHEFGPTVSDDEHHVAVPFSFDDGRAARVVLHLSEPTDVRSEIRSMLMSIAPVIQSVATRQLADLEVLAHTRDLDEAAHRDALTGTLNRRALDETPNDPGPRGVMMVDIDRFKSVNDTYGHAAGDEVLSLVATAIASVLRSSEAVYRYGGEEFAILVRTSSSAYLADIAERVRAAVADLDTGEILAGRHLTVSVGAHLLEPGGSLAQGLAQADQSLLLAKEGGRDRVVVG